MRSVLVLWLLLLLSTAATASAAMTYDSYTGPVAIPGTGYQWTINVTTLTPPDNVMCLAYSVDGAAATKVPCTGSNGPGNAGTWTCLIPEYDSATVDWDLSVWSAGSGGTCGALRTQGPSGTFQTGPLAVTLSAFRAEGQTAGPLLAAAIAVSLASAAALRAWRLRCKLA
jgi:hypothetical protein